MRLVHATGKTLYKILYQHTMYVISLTPLRITSFPKHTRKWRGTPPNFRLRMRHVISGSPIGHAQWYYYYNSSTKNAITSGSTTTSHHHLKWGFVTTYMCIYYFRLCIYCQQNNTKSPHLKLTLEVIGLVWFGLVWFMMFNATFNNISVISWRLVLLVGEYTSQRYWW
jgi:hypothetical protein